MQLRDEHDRLIRSTQDAGALPFASPLRGPFAADGTLVIPGLSPGEVQPELVTVVQMGMPIPQRLELLPRVRLRAGETTEVVVRLPHLVPGRVRGRVVREGQSSWPPATQLSLRGVPGSSGTALPARTHGPITAASDGTFEATVPPGRYRLAVWNAPSGQEHTQSEEAVEVAPGQDVEQTFILR